MSRIVDFFKGILSLALIVALLAGVPALLLIIVGFPLPTELPSVQLISTHIEDGNIPDIFVVKTLALVVWIVWIQLAVAVLTEVFGLLRGRASGRAPVLPGIQIFAGKMVASTVLIVSALAPSRAATAAPIVPLAAEELVSLEATPGEPGLTHQGESGVPGQAVVVTAGGPAQDAPQARAAGRYATRSGDNWWDIAERLLGDGMRWSELRDLNRGKTMLTGEMVSEQTETVRGGWRLDVPADADPRLLDHDAGIADDAGTEAATGPAVDDDGSVTAAARGDDDDGVAAEDDPADVSSPLMRAIRPHTLVFEGPTGMIDDRPGVPYQVVEGDNLWDIADRHLDDPFRWPEIFEHSNQLRQTFGRQITDPNLIWPDSILWLPGDAVDVPTADADLVLEVVGPTSSARSDGGQATSIQPEDLQSATESAREIADAADLPPAGPDGPDDPDRQRRPTDGNTIRSLENANIGNASLSIADRLAGPPGLAFGVGGLFVASGLFGLLARTRKLRLSESGERSKPAPPPMELVDIETVLRNSADSRRALSVHGAIRSLSNRSVMPGEPVATPEVVRISSDRIEVVQRGDDPDLPAPWLAGQNPALDVLADRSLAVLPAEFFADAGDEGDWLDSPAPTCVTIGGGLMVNLEAVGVLGIDGPPELAAGLIRSMVHELATGPARRSIDIRVSDWLPGADLHQHVRCGPLDNLDSRLGPWLEDVELGLTASGGFSVYAVRVAGTAGAMPHSTVIFADAADAASVAPLVERANRRSLPLAVVFSGDLSQLEAEPETMIRLDAETLRLEPHGFTAAMQYLDVDLVLGAESLINHARQAPMVLRGDDQSTITGPTDHLTDPAQAPTEETPEQEIPTELPAEEHEITDQAEDADTGMLVRVLGPVEFEGGPGDLSEPERSLLAFLALVGPSTAEQIKDAVWPGGGIEDADFQAIVERLHDLLGPRFPMADDGRYRLRSVITDLGSARRWITQAQSMSEDRARNLLQLALADVRGEPFSDVSERYWQWTADHRMALATQASSMLMDACFDLCDSAYGANDVYLAKWACDVGSLIDPLHETVITRKVQLLQLMGSSDEALRVVEAWEAGYEEAASRPAPRGVRLALQHREGATPYVG